MQNILWFTFATRGTDYETLSERCVNTCADFNLQVHRILYDNQKDWMKNALVRAKMLHEIALDNPRWAVGMLDCDVYAICYPSKLVWMPDKFDFACEYRGEGAERFRRYSAGVTMFNNTQLGRMMLYEWARTCTLDPTPKQKLREQFYLYECKDLMDRRGLNFENLGEKYNRKPEKVRKGDDTILIHSVASREQLKKIGGKR